jgi:hypothetical protein
MLHHTFSAFFLCFLLSLLSKFTKLDCPDLLEHLSFPFDKDNERQVNNAFFYVNTRESIINIREIQGIYPILWIYTYLGMETILNGNSVLP